MLQSNGSEHAEYKSRMIVKIRRFHVTSTDAYFFSVDFNFSIVDASSLSATP